MAELADAPDLESGSARSVGSIPTIRTIDIAHLSQSGTSGLLRRSIFVYDNKN